MRKLAWLSALPLAAVSAFAIPVPQTISSLLKAIFIELPSVGFADENLVLFGRFIIFLLAFSVFHFGIKQVPTMKEPAHKGFRVTVSIILGLMGTILLPTGWIQAIFQLYSGVIGLLVAAVPAIAAIYLWKSIPVETADGKGLGYGGKILRAVILLALGIFYLNIADRLTDDPGRLMPPSVVKELADWIGLGAFIAFIVGIIQLFPSFSKKQAAEAAAPAAQVTDRNVQDAQAAITQILQQNIRAIPDLQTNLNSTMGALRAYNDAFGKDEQLARESHAKLSTQAGKLTNGLNAIMTSANQLSQAARTIRTGLRGLLITARTLQDRVNDYRANSVAIPAGVEQEVNALVNTEIPAIIADTDRIVADAQAIQVNVQAVHAQIQNAYAKIGQKKPKDAIADIQAVEQLIARHLQTITDLERRNTDLSQRSTDTRALVSSINRSLPAIGGRGP